MKILFASLALLLLAVGVFAEDCKPTIDGKKYDFSKVSKPGNDYTIKLTQGATTSKFWINLCTPISQDCNGPTNLAGCQRWNDPTYTFGSALGNAGSTVWKAGDKSLGKENVIAYNAGGAQNQIIQLVCDKSTEATLVSMNPQKDANNDWTFTMNTKYACSGSASSGGGLSGGWVFVIILLVCATVYLVGGILFNKFHRHQAGKDLVPNVNFWTALPGLCKDGCMFIVNKIRGGRGGYSQV